ncbi:hypothetical protein B0H13DRAFT_2336390 [Mycena leptocephala]|nr:hypothetical protein B0H13DRAFT_2336390 [Mycena leptocephala]
MHSSLIVQNIGRLPAHLQRLVTSAANGSFVDLEKICALIEGNLDTSRSRSYLPVLFSNLDPSRIPTPDELDSLLSTPAPAEIISRPIAVFGALRWLLTGSSSEVLPDLWPRVWVWMQFIHSYHSSNVNCPSPQRIYGIFVVLLRRFKCDPRTCHSFNATKGVGVVIGRAWLLLVESFKADGIHPLGFEELHFLLHDVDNTTIDEYAEGAGGDLVKLASLVIHHIRASTQDRCPCSARTFTTFCLAAFRVKPHGDSHTGKCCDGPFRTVLLSQGGVTELTRFMCALGAPEHADVGGKLYACSKLLMQLLHTSPGYPWIRESLQQGLLRAIVVSATHITNPQEFLWLEHILEAVLPVSTIYHSVLSTMEAAVHDVEELVESDRFKKSPIFGKWQDFMVLVQERLAILRRFDAKDCTSNALKACDNMDCGLITRKDILKSCSNCSVIYYCSDVCQRLDWKAGHREVCKRLQSLRLTEPQPFTTRNKSFMRALLHHDYEQMKTEILTRQLAFRSYHPGENFVVQFTYQTGRASVQLLAFVGYELTEDLNDYQMKWRDLESRVLRSNGRMELHTMECANARSRLFPMRSATSEVHDGLILLARNVKATEDELRAELAALVALDVVEIH